MVNVITVHATQALSHAGNPASPWRAAEGKGGLEKAKDQLREEAALRVWHTTSQEPVDHLKSEWTTGVILPQQGSSVMERQPPPILVGW